MDRELIEDIFEVYDQAKNRILLYVQASLPNEQFMALRKLILDELGLSGAEGKIKNLWEKHQRERPGKN